MTIPTKATPFHEGELRAQQLAGGGPPGFAIREAMPDQHRDFFAMLRYMMVATLGHDGWPVASIVTGPSGFMTSPHPDQLVLDHQAHWMQEFKPLLQPGQAVGMLGIDLHTRRRNRVNGTVTHLDEDGLHLAVSQSFGNCPKYIQLRDIDDDTSHVVAAVTKQSLIDLDAQAMNMIANADTLFVATSSGASTATNGGVDISHKGGRPGFVRIDGNSLTIPDFVGNRYFNTLGNILNDSRTALLIIDFTNGDVLHLQGHTEILWNSEDTSQLAGAQRLWRFHTERGWHAKNAVPLRWQFKGFAPTTEATGIWPLETA